MEEGEQGETSPGEGEQGATSQEQDGAPENENVDEEGEGEDDEEEEEEDDEGGEQKIKKTVTQKEAQDEARTIKQIQLDSLRDTFEGIEEDASIPVRGTILESQLTEKNIHELGDAFKNAPNHAMDMKTFQETLKNIAHIYLPQNEVKILFLKIDTKKDGVIDWDEFLSHIILEMNDKDAGYEREELHPPICGYPRLMKTFHRLPVIRITFLPILEPDRSVSFLKGRYVTLSRDGMIHYWSLDYEMEATFHSECQELKVSPTWITDLVCIPDVNIICTSSTERELRFYDCTGHKFDLRIVISQLDFPVMCMTYAFFMDINRYSKLIAGTMSGSILVFSFSAINKGPFFFTPGKYLTTIRYCNVVKGELPGMSVAEYNQIHCDWVKQVSYYPNMNSFLSCAADSENSLVMIDSQDNKSIFTNPGGINCFTIEEAMHILVTGGFDCSVRVWNVFVPTKPTCVFFGHHAPIVAVVTQNQAKRVYSLAKDKCIKVWDVQAQKCIQTYIGMPQEVGSSGLCTLYNPSNRNLLVGGSKMALLILGVVVDQERSDGFTHSMAVVRALFNPLFRCVVTVGLDSLIMVWDPWDGRRVVMVRNAHTRNYYGDPIAVEITAACFDPGYQDLVTGARDGSLKVWNFNTGTCTRTMHIELFCEVTNVLWLRSGTAGRILAIGWNRHVTEFSDESVYSNAKEWETRHSHDVLCAVAGGQSLATSSDNGELILWRLETGQAYRRYSVATPNVRIIMTQQTVPKDKTKKSSLLRAGTVEGIRKSSLLKNIRSKIVSQKKVPESKIDPNLPIGKPTESTDIVLAQKSPKERRKSDTVRPTMHVLRRMSMSLMAQDTVGGRRPSMSERRASISDHLRRRASLDSRAASRGTVASGASGASGASTAGPGKHTRRVSIVALPGKESMSRQVSATAMLFLNTRPMKPGWGSLIVAVDKGLIQVWSHHTAGGCIANFIAIHLAGDYVCAMDTDPQNRYLFTGTALGYIKVWLMENYGFPECEKVHICMPLLRLEFPFLWRDRVEGRAKRSLRDQKWPLLLNSYRGHLLHINSIEVLMDERLVITGSSDASVRIWTIGGRYLNTLGTVREWNPLKVARNAKREYRIPPDVKLVASSATLKVLNGGAVQRTHFKFEDDSVLLRDLPQRLVEKATYGKRASSPVLGRYFQIPRNKVGETRFKIECFPGHVPVYRFINCPGLEEIKLPPPPEVIVNRTRHREGKKKRTRTGRRHGAGKTSGQSSASAHSGISGASANSNASLASAGSQSSAESVASGQHRRTTGSRGHSFLSASSASSAEGSTVSD